MPPMPPPPPQPKKKGKAWKIVLLVIGIPLLLLGSLFGCGMLYEWTAKDMPIRPEDRAVVFQASDLAPWMDASFEVLESAVTLTKRKYLDGAITLEYTYEPPNDGSPFIYCSLTVEESASDAKAAYIGMGVGESLVMSFEDVDAQERDDLFRGGDASTFGLLVDEESKEPFGNFFRCRVGSRVVDLYTGGLYFDDAESVKALLDPVIERIRGYEP